MPRDPGFVAAPADIRAVIVEYRGVRLIFPYQLPPALELIGLLLAVGAFAAGAVEPDVEQRPVLGEELGQLIAVIHVVLVAAVVFGVAVPRREIHAELDAAARAGLGAFFDNVALYGRVLHRMLGIAARPQAEAVVMLGGEHQAFHAGALDRLDPLVAVEIHRVEAGLVLAAFS